MRKNQPINKNEIDLTIFFWKRRKLYFKDSFKEYQREQLSVNKEMINNCKLKLEHWKTEMKDVISSL